MQMTNRSGVGQVRKDLVRGPGHWRIGHWRIGHERVKRIRENSRIARSDAARGRLDCRENLGSEATRYAGEGGWMGVPRGFKRVFLGFENFFEKSPCMKALGSISFSSLADSNSVTQDVAGTKEAGQIDSTDGSSMATRS